MKKQKLAILILFLLYVISLLKLTVFRQNVYYSERQLNLTLFSDLIRIYRNGSLRFFLRMFLGNIGWFVPFGMLVPPLLKRENLAKTAGLGMLFSLAIETMQFIFRKGVAELDDVILNTTGAIIGYGLYKLLRYWWTSVKNKTTRRNKRRADVSQQTNSEL